MPKICKQRNGTGALDERRVRCLKRQHTNRVRARRAGNMCRDVVFLAARNHDARSAGNEQSKSSPLDKSAGVL